MGDLTQLTVRDSLGTSRLAIDGDGRANSSFGDNLIRNWSFEWGASATTDPYPWILSGAGAAYAQDTSWKKYGSKSGKVTYGSATAQLKQTLDRWTDLKGKNIVLIVWCKPSANGIAKIGIDDGVTTTYSAVSSGTGEQLLFVTKTISGSATTVDILLQVTGAGNVLWDGVMVNVGLLYVDPQMPIWEETVKCVHAQVDGTARNDRQNMRMEVGLESKVGSGLITQTTDVITYQKQFKIVWAYLVVLQRVNGDEDDVLSPVYTGSSSSMTFYQKRSTGVWDNTKTYYWRWVAIGVD